MDFTKTVGRFVNSRVLRGLLTFILIVSVSGLTAKSPPRVVAVEAAQTLNADQTVTVTVYVEAGRRRSDDKLWCYIGTETNSAYIPEDKWIEAEGGVARFDVAAGSYYAFVKDEFGNHGVNMETAAINQVIAVELDIERIYLPLEDTRTINASLFVLGDIDDTITWASSDERVVTVENGVILTHAPGTAIVTATAGSAVAESEIIVSDLFIKPYLPPTVKPYLPAYAYTQEEAHLLDAALASRINEAGYGTRAGAVAAARFLTLEFPWRVPYFFENGRLDNHLGGFCDGEGRYYHKGLYLSEDKFEDIEASFVGPAIWGAPLLNFEEKYGFIRGVRYPNGLDCSGFVTWALYNGGFDVGDVGAGDYSFRDDDLCDLGQREWLTRDLLESGRVKVGDLIGEDGHIAIIIGLDEEYIYIAESLYSGVKVTKLTRDRGVFNAGIYDYVMLMDDVYGDDGNYTVMWDQPEEPVAA